MQNQLKFYTKKVLKQYIKNMDMQHEKTDFHIKDLQDVLKVLEHSKSKQKNPQTEYRIGDACFIIECLINNLKKK